MSLLSLAFSRVFRDEELISSAKMRRDDWTLVWTAEVDGRRSWSAASTASVDGGGLKRGRGFKRGRAGFRDGSFGSRIWEDIDGRKWLPFSFSYAVYFLNECIFPVLFPFFGKDWSTNTNNLVAVEILDEISFLYFIFASECSDELKEIPGSSSGLVHPQLVHSTTDCFLKMLDEGWNRLDAMKSIVDLSIG